MHPFDITRAYHEYIGSKPLRETALLAGLGGLGVYFGAKPALQLLARSAAAGGGEEAQKALTLYERSGGLDTARKRLGILAAMAGAAYGLYKHSDYKGGLSSIKQSMLDPDYWKNNPERQKAYSPFPERYATEPMSPNEQQAVWEDMTSFNKTASAQTDPSFFVRPISVADSIHLIQNDPLLLQTNKNKVSNIVQSSSPNGSITSGFHLADTALNAGVSFGAAYMFGQGLGSLLAMPAPLRNRMSMAGGIASAVIGSGILKQL